MTRAVKIVRGIETDVVDDGTSYEGPYDLSTTASIEYEARLLRAGKDISPANNQLQIRVAQGQVGGDHLSLKRPPRGGLMPRAFTDPHRVMVGYGTAGNTDATLQLWEGQSNTGVKEYKRFLVETTAGPRPTNQQNIRMFSYRGDLLFVADGFSINGNNYTRQVEVFRWDVVSELFVKIKIFDEEVVDIMERGRLQQGVPDAVVIDDEVYVFYRVLDREEGANRILGFKSSGDLDTWTKVTDYEIEDSLAVEFDSFRLRVAYGADTLMVSYFGITELTFEGPTQKDVFEFRTFLSFDRGITLTPNERSIRSLSVSSQVNSPTTARLSLVSDVGNQSLHNFFIPEYKPGAAATDYDGTSVNYDLYFDESIGSFVILKQGDPDPPSGTFIGNQTGNNFLIAIKTVDGNFSLWEPCAKLLLDYQITGFTDNQTDPFDESTGATDFWGYKLHDVKVIPGRGVNTILMSVTERDDSATNFSHGVLIAEFKLVDRTLFRPGNYEKVIAYGQRHHPRYSLVTSLMNVEQQGIISTARRMTASGGQRVWNGVTGCRWRNQIVAAGKQATDDSLKFFAIAAPWTNMGEHVDYQYSYTPYFGQPPNSWYLNHNTLGTGTVTYDATDFLTTDCQIAAGGDAAYISDGTAGGATEHASYRASRGDFAALDFKTWFRLKIENNPAGAGWTEVLRIRLASLVTTNGRELRMRILGNGNIDFMDDSDTLIETVAAALDLSKTWEFMVKIGSTYDGDNRIIFFYREFGTRYWTAGGVQSLVPFGAGLGVPATLFGIISYSAQNGQIVKIGEIRMGSASRLFRPAFSERYDYYLEGRIEAANKRQAFTNGWTDDPYIARPAFIYDNEFDLPDGGRVELIGKTPRDTGTLFTYSRSLSRNTKLNVNNKVAASTYDFTDTHDNVANKTEFILRNTNRMNFDTVSLINLVGVNRVTVRTGTYNEVTKFWSADTATAYDLGYIDLDVSSVTDNYIVLNDAETWATSELRGYTIIVNDDVNGLTDSFVVVDNFDEVIIVDGTLPAIGAGDTLRLYPHSSTLSGIDAAVGGVYSTYIGIECSSPANATMRHLGEIVVGNSVDFQDVLTEFQREVSTSWDLDRSDTGFAYIQNTFSQALLEKGTLTFDAMKFSEITKVHRVLDRISRDNGTFAIEMTNRNDRKVTRYGILSSQTSVSRPSFSYRISSEISLQDWTPTSTSEYQVDAPVINGISMDVGTPYAGQTVTFTADAVDPGGLTLSYVWEWGDLTANGSGVSDTHAYASLGEYLLTLTVTNSAGASAQRLLRLYVDRYWIDRYNLIVSNTSPPANTLVTLTVVSQNDTPATVTADYATVWTWSVDVIDPGGNAGFDANNDFTYTFTDEADLKHGVVAGVGQNFYMPRTSGTYVLTGTDQAGRTVTTTLTVP